MVKYLIRIIIKFLSIIIDCACVNFFYKQNIKCLFGNETRKIRLGRKTICFTALIKTIELVRLNWFEHT